MIPATPPLSLTETNKRIRAVTMDMAVLAGQTEGASDRPEFGLGWHADRQHE
jgi:hypothetical protein